MNKKNILIITGPTGVGKTEFVLDFANQIPSEIINIDVGQFYEKISIGTAKPNWQTLAIPHHLFDIISDPKNISVYEYRKIVIDKIEEVINRNKKPILVGGSGFYIQSLFFPPVSDNNSADQLIFNEENLWEQLFAIDAKRALEIDKKDIYRIKRALEIWQNSNKKPSEYIPIYDPPYNFSFVVLDRDRSELYNRIDLRVIEMFNEGWINEVKNLKPDWRLFLKQKKLIGYDDIINFLESNDISKELLIKTIQQKVRNYSKRQLTFLRMLTKKIINAELQSSNEFHLKKIFWLNLSECDNIQNL